MFDLKMTKIIGWKPEGESITLKCMGEGNEEIFFIPIPVDVYKELLVDGPPNDEKSIRDLIVKIQVVRKERILTVENVDKELKDIDDKEKSVMDKLEGAIEELDVKKYSAMLRALAGRRANQGQRRYLAKLLHQEEGALSKELMTKM
jgi:hypothetical protein